jgi:hypothetical protein
MGYYPLKVLAIFLFGLFSEFGVSIIPLILTLFELIFESIRFI